MSFLRPLQARVIMFLSLICWVISYDVDASQQASIQELHFIDTFGKPFAFESTKGKASIVLFGYTSCPDVCPMGLTILGSILKDLGSEATRLNAVFISVDPTRDTADVLQAYVRWFHKDIIGLTGSTKQIDTAVSAFSAQYELHQNLDNDNNYAVDHSAGFYLLDANAQLIQIVPFGLPAEHTLHAVKKLIAASK